MAPPAPRDHQAEIDSLRVNLASIENSISNAEAETTRVNAEIDAINAGIQTSSAELTKVRSAIEQTAQDQASFDGEIDNRYATELPALKATLKQGTDALEAQLEQKQQQLADILDQADSLPAVILLKQLGGSLT